MKGKPSGALLKDILRVLALTAFFAAAAVILGNREVRAFLFDIPTVQKVLSGSAAGPFSSALIFIIAAGALIALGVPRLLASAVGGVIYGALAGTVLSVLASLLGSSFVYLLGRVALADLVERRFTGKLEVWQGRFRDNAFWWVLYGRLFPFSNSTLMSLLCGSCAVPFIQYTFASLIGFMPMAVVFAFYGSGGMQGNFWQIGIATALLVFSIISRRIFEKLFPRSRTETAG